MAPAPDLGAFICDLLDIAKPRKGRLSGFLERHTPPEVFIGEQINMEAQFFIYFAFRLLGV
jgi:hypothetical protein